MPKTDPYDRALLKRILKEVEAEILDEAIENARVREIPHELDELQSPYMDRSFLSDVRLVGESEDELHDGFDDVTVTEIGYADDGRVVQLLSNGTTRIIDPYSGDTELFEFWQEMTEYD